jgi:hypothetical protein
MSADPDDGDLTSGCGEKLASSVEERGEGFVTSVLTVWVESEREAANFRDQSQTPELDSMGS